MLRLVLLVLTIFQISSIKCEVANNVTDIANLYFQYVENATISHECKIQLNLLALGLGARKEWALKMLDATAKPQAGILLGNIMHVGNYDECLEVDEDLFGMKIQGKYCTAVLQAHPTYGEDFAKLLTSLNAGDKVVEGDILMELRKSYGVCVPKGCTIEDLRNLSNSIEEEFQSPAHFHFAEEYCDGGEKPPFSAAAIVAIFVFSAFAVIVVCSTLYDVFCYQRLAEKSPNLFVAFSVLTNTQRLLSTQTTESTLGCLNGMRVISMMWIIIAHGYQFAFFTPEVNAVHIIWWKDHLLSSIIMAASVAVDTFFTISGLLLVYLFMKSNDKGVKFSLPMFYLHRILRLTPSLAMVALLSATLITHMGSGPFWPAMYVTFQESCEKNWWSTVTYLQNYVHTHNQCVGQAWYLAVDTQMYFLSPVVLFPLLRWPKQTIGAIGVFVVLNCAYVFEISWKKQLGATFFSQDEAQYAYIYSPTHVRGTVYLMGMVCGYFIFQTKNKRLELRKSMVALLWVLSLLALTGIVFAHSSFNADQYTVLEGALFNSLSRVSWSGALCVVILLCVNGYGGVVNSFLSSNVFTVLIRLNYNVYLLHLLVIGEVVGQGRTPIHFSNLVGFHSFWGNYAFSLGAAVVWTLAFESPVLVIEKIVFGQKKKSHPKKSLENGVKNGIGAENKVCDVPTISTSSN